MPRIEISRPTNKADQRLARDVWLAAAATRRRPPSAARADRVSTKICEADVLLVLRYGGVISAMALAEPYVDPTAPDPLCGHISMLFVHPARWGLGLGSALLNALQRDPEPYHWPRLSVWTRTDNRRALRLYDAGGFIDTGDRARLLDGDEIQRLAWHRTRPDAEFDATSRPALS